MPIETSKRLQTYELTIRDISEDDVNKLHELSVGVHWPHRPDDWRMLLSLGKGYVGCDKIGRIAACVMWIPMGDNSVNISMLITSPRLQTLGAGRWMMKHVMQCCKQYSLTLNATKAAYRLYESLSFKPIRTIYQHQGIAKSVVGIALPEDTQIRPFESHDKDSVYALDKRAGNLERVQILDVLIEHSQCLVMEKNGEVMGFSLCRKFGRGHVIGPVVAVNTQAAIALIAPHANTHSGHFLRLDTAQEDTVLKNFLEQCGMVEYDTVTHMAMSAIEEEKTELHTYALASQALN